MLFMLPPADGAVKKGGACQVLIVVSGAFNHLMGTGGDGDKVSMASTVSVYVVYPLQIWAHCCV